MKCAGRIVYLLLSGLSLLLLLSTAAIWVRSFWVGDELNWQNLPDRSHVDRETIWCSRGGVRFSVYHWSETDSQLWGDWCFIHLRDNAAFYPSVELLPNCSHYAALGFEAMPEAGLMATARVAHMVIRSFTVPLYFPCLLFAILPAHYLLRLRRRRRFARRLAQGCCIACGYDLRASSGRCPECGTVPEVTA